MTYHLVVVRSSGYSARSSFQADTLAEAARRHVSEWANRKTSFALVMRDANGKRYSCEDSRALAA